MINLNFAFCIALVALFVAPASARWTGNSGFTTDLSFTDNLYLTEDDAESDALLNVRPYINYSTSGTRASASIAYGPGFLFYGNNSELNDIRHIGSANGRVEFVKDIFAIRALANANQNLVTPTDAATFNTYSNPDAFRQTASFQIIPEIRFPIVDNKYASMRIEPGLNFVYVADAADDEGLSNRGGARSRVTIDSGRYFTRTPWSINYSNDVFDADSDDRWGRVNGKVGYVVSPRYRFDFNLGYESVNSGSAVNRSQEGARWRLDFSWTPNERTSLTVGGGYAFYGQDWLLRFRHRQKKTEWSADYRVQFATAADEILDQEVIPQFDSLGGSIANPFTRLQDCFGVGSTSVGTPALTNQVYQGDVFNARVGYLLGRSVLSLKVRADRRQYQNTGQDTFDGYGCFNIRRAVSRNTSGSFSLDYWDHSDDDFGFGSRDFTQYALRLAMQYRLGRRTSTSLSFNHAKRDADVIGGSFDENYLRLIFALQL